MVVCVFKNITTINLDFFDEMGFKDRIKITSSKIAYTL
jgi:hypothetical protein